MKIGLEYGILVGYVFQRTVQEFVWRD